MYEIGVTTIEFFNLDHRFIFNGYYWLFLYIRCFGLGLSSIHVCQQSTILATQSM